MFTIYGAPVSGGVLDHRRATASKTLLAQIFNSGSGDAILDSRIHVSRVGSPTGTFQLDLYDSVAHKPGSSQGVIGTADVATAPVHGSAVSFTPGAPLALNSNTEYFIVLSSDVALSDTHYAQVHHGIDFNSGIWTYDPISLVWFEFVFEAMFELDMSAADSLYITPNLQFGSIEDMFDQSLNNKLVIVPFSDLVLIGDTAPANFSTVYKGTMDRVLRLDIGAGLKYYELPVGAFANLSWNHGEHFFRVSTALTDIQRFKLVLHGNDAAR